MGFIDMYARLIPDVTVKQPVLVTPPEEVIPSVPLLDDAKEVTLAQYDRHTKDVITAHRMKDYRRKNFNLVLLPKVEILFDKMLEGREYWGELLSDESTYSQ